MGRPMDASSPPAAPPPAEHPPVPFSRHRGWFGIDRAPGPPWRSRHDRVATGLAGGIAEWLSVPSLPVRAALAFVLVGTGFGPVLYVALAMVLPVADRSVAPKDRPLRFPRGRELEQAVVALVVALGLAILLRAVGVWMGGDLGVPAAVAAAGLSLVWSRTDEERREVWRSRLVRLPGDEPPSPAAVARARSRSVGRTLVGLALFVTGAGWVLATAEPGTAVPVLLAVGATVSGLGLLAGPWVVDLWQDLSDERRQRIRSEERAEVASQLHDSVLQTLALIQRDPDTPRRVAQLARQQERSLRRWLFDDELLADPATAVGTDLSDLPPPPTFSGRLRVAADSVEDQFGVVVEVVAVGDATADDRTDALVAAAREAMANAARHGGVDDVAVYAELTPAAATVFVRDRGAGFDPALVPSDRRGVRDSIVARIGRQGGTATVTSAPGEGTEVALEVPR
jgi:signal transduction histidine kinase/phage shock protein PspC (stress-responsive transcriptional regulator)